MTGPDPPPDAEHTLDLVAGVDALETVMRVAEHTLDALGWGQRPRLLWVRVGVPKHFNVVDFSMRELLKVTADPVDLIEGLTAVMPTLPPTMGAIIFAVDSITTDWTGTDIQIREVFGLAIATGREVYLVRQRGGDLVRWPPPDDDEVMLGLRRMVRRAAAMRDQDPIRIPEEWT